MLNNLNSDIEKPESQQSTIEVDKINERIEAVQNQVNDLESIVQKPDVEKESITATGIYSDNLQSTTGSIQNLTTSEVHTTNAEINHIVGQTEIGSARIGILEVQSQVPELNVGFLEGNTIQTNHFATCEFHADYLHSDEVHTKNAFVDTITTPYGVVDEIHSQNIDTKELTSETIEATDVTASQGTFNLISAEEVNMETLQSSIATFTDTITKALSADNLTLTNVINLDPELQTPEDWYTLTIPNYNAATILLHYKWMDGDNNVIIQKTKDSAIIQYDVTNQNAIKSISFTREDGSIKVQLRADSELQYSITLLKEEEEKEIRVDYNGGEYVDYIFVPSKLHSYVFKGFGYNDYSLEFPGLARFAILEADEEQFELLSTNVLAINNAIRLPIDWDELGNVVDRSDGADRQIIRMAEKNGVLKPTYEDPLDNKRITPLEYTDEIPTQNTIANYNGTVLNRDEEEVYPITELGNNTTTHGHHEVKGDLKVTGEILAHTIDVDKDVAIRGNLYVEGTTVSTTETQVATTGNYIVTRENAVQGLGEHQYAGLVVNRYKYTPDFSGFVSVEDFIAEFDIPTDATETYTTPEGTVYLCPNKTITLGGKLWQDGVAYDPNDYTYFAVIDNGIEYTYIWTNGYDGTAYDGYVMVKERDGVRGVFVSSEEVSKSAGIVVDKEGTIGISSDVTINNKTYTDISQYDNILYEGLSRVVSSATLDIITDSIGDEKEDCVYYNGNYYHYTGEDWVGPLQYSEEKGLYGEVVEIPALESLPKSTLQYYKTVTTQSIDPNTVQAIATRTDTMDDKYYPVWDNTTQQLTTAVSCIHSEPGDESNTRNTIVDAADSCFQVCNEDECASITIKPDLENTITMTSCTGNTIYMNSTHCNSVHSGLDISTRSRRYELKSPSDCDTGLACSLERGAPIPYGENFIQCTTINNKTTASIIPATTVLYPSTIGIEDGDHITGEQFFNTIIQCHIPQGTLLFSRNSNSFTVDGLHEEGDEIIYIDSVEQTDRIEYWGDAEGYRNNNDTDSFVYFLWTDYRGQQTLFQGSKVEEDPYGYWEYHKMGGTAVTNATGYYDTCRLLITDAYGRAVQKDPGICIFCTEDRGVSIGVQNVLLRGCGYSKNTTMFGTGLRSGCDDVNVGMWNCYWPNPLTPDDMSTVTYGSVMVGIANNVCGGYPQVVYGRSNQVHTCRNGDGWNTFVGTSNRNEEGVYSLRNQIFGIGNRMCNFTPATPREANDNNLFGRDNITYGNFTNAIGRCNIVCYPSSYKVLIGENNIDYSCANHGIAIGSNNIICASGNTCDRQLALGWKVCSRGGCSVGIGFCTSVCNGAIRLGTEGCAASYGVSIGFGAQTKEAYGVAIGHYAQSCSQGGVAIGYCALIKKYSTCCGLVIGTQVSVQSGLSINGITDLVITWYGCLTPMGMRCSIWPILQNQFGTSGKVKGFGKTLVTNLAGNTICYWDDRSLFDICLSCTDYSCWYIGSTWYGFSTSCSILWSGPTRGMTHMTIMRTM